MKIAVDIDEVLADTLSAYLERYNKLFETKYKREEFYEYRFWKIHGGTRDEAIRHFSDFMNERGERVLPFHGAFDVLHSLKNAHEFISITSRPRYFSELTKRWVRENFPEIFSDIYFTNAYASDGSAEVRKVVVAQEQKVELLIDDDLGHCVECASAGIHAYIFDAPWNRNGKLPSGVERIFSWEEIRKKLNKGMN